MEQARYALICQSEGIVPIVEPDLVLAGTHTLEDAVEASHGPSPHTGPHPSHTDPHPSP